MYFYVAILIVALACSTITIKTLVGYSSINFLYKIIISFFIIMGWFTPIIIGVIRQIYSIDVGTYTIIHYTCYYLFGFVFILFIVLMLRDIVWYTIYGLSYLLKLNSWSINPKNISLLDTANILVVLTSFIISLYALYNGLKTPIVNELTYSSPKISQNLKAVQISDLHINRTTQMNQIYRLVNQINALNPDVIFITGDTVDDDIAYIDKQLNALQSLIAPQGIYIVGGNHELYNNLSLSFSKFHQLGFKILFNKGLHIGRSNIFVSGVPDAQTSAKHFKLNTNFMKALKGSTSDNYKILLSHNPDMVDNINSITYNLQLSGHTHGGQIFPFHLLAKKANHYLAGSYKVNNVDLYVNRGAGYWGPSMRLFAPAEVTLINFIPQK